jgi:uncharacterized membrane protein
MTRYMIFTLSQKWVILLKYSGLYHGPLLAACIIGLYVISEAAFTITLLGVLLYKYVYDNIDGFLCIFFQFQED